MLKRFILTSFLIFGFVFSFCLKACAMYFGPTWGPKEEISVYIPQENPYSSTMREAFEKWQKCTNNKIKFLFIQENKNADVTVNFSDKVDGSDGDVGAYSTTVQGGLIVKATITIATDSPQKSSDKLIYNVMLHEIGHILGLPDSNRNLGIMHSPVNEKQSIITNDIVKLFRFNSWSTMDHRINIIK